MYVHMQHHTFTLISAYRHTHTHTHTSCETAKNKKDATRMFKIASFFLDTPRREVGG